MEKLLKALNAKGEDEALDNLRKFLGAKPVTLTLSLGLDGTLDIAAIGRPPIALMIETLKRGLQALEQMEAKKT